MGFYDTDSGVDQYFALADGYDGAEIISQLHPHLPQDSTVLELGMGPGKDLEILSRRYKTTGSDNSEIFLNRYLKSNPTADLLMLDAITLKTDRSFDCIYSNKVLHHITREELAQSFKRQQTLLNSRGVLCHTFWKGDGEESHEGLRFIHYQEEELNNLLAGSFEILVMESYREMGADDSILVIARLKS